MSEIYIDYIGVVVENPDGFLEYKKFPIDKPYNGLYEELKAMADNENRSVLDLQNKFELYFNKNRSQMYFNYCYPEQYDLSYVIGVYYPIFKTYEQYKVIEKGGEKVSASKYDWKKRFLKSAYSYINAYSYSQMLECLKRNPKNKMFSSESKGWTVYDYKINDYTEFQVRSNFGYGSASYFYVNLKYKGIDILPYSDLVKYYKAEMYDFIRYTRQYNPNRDNWDLALDFVVETSNFAIKDESAFIEKWIFNEIEEMMRGLERLAINPLEEYRLIANNKLNTLGLIFVRNISDNEIKKYNIYPTETVVAFQAEKIAGALLLLEQIRTLNSVYEKAERVIDRIKEINLELLPQFKKAISSAKLKLHSLQVTHDILIEKENALKEKCKPFEEECKSICNKEKGKGKDKITYGIYCVDVHLSNIKSKYIADHPEYKNMLAEIRVIQDKIYYLKDDINGLIDFIKLLTECAELIDEYVVVA